MANRDIIEKILLAVPQRAPFRFIDDILLLDEERITGAYRFKENEYFYQGHFPNMPITPGVILIEAMAQTGVVAFGIYLLMLSDKTSGEEIQQFVTLFTSIEAVEFTGIVKPGELVLIHSEKVYFRKMSIKVKARMERENGEIICTGIISGMAVKNNTA